MNGDFEHSGSDYDSSDSTNSSSSSASSIETRHNVVSSGMVWETDTFGEFININCGDNRAKFYLSKFARGSVGQSVLFEGRWMTPNEFQSVSGRQSSKDWKRSIRTNGRCLKEYISEGILTEHSKSCSCGVCVGGGDHSLRREGEIAMAAKKRRLSQADGTARTTPIGEKKGNKGRNKSDEKKVWSPSGEMAHDGSSNEDEYRPKAEGDAMHPHSVIDISDFIPRRSRRSAHRKHNGHRTELGTFTNKPINWDSEEVAEFLRQQGFSDYATPFLQCGIDGQSLFLLKEHHLFERFNMKLGPALRLLDVVSRLRHPPLL